MRRMPPRASRKGGSRPRQRPPRSEPCGVAERREAAGPTMRFDRHGLRLPGVTLNSGHGPKHRWPGPPFPPMKTWSLRFLSVIVLAGSGCATEPAVSDSLLVPVSPVTPPVVVGPTQPTAGEVTLTGLIEQRMAVGGETPGWVLRYDQDKRIELLFRVEDLLRVRLAAGMPVALTGSYVTRVFPERGEVRFLSVRVFVEIQTSTETPRGR